jgi:hypothetical protein
VTWAASSTPAIFLDVTFGNGIFTAITSTSAYTSTDGITWSAATAITGSTNTLSVAFGNNLFITGGFSGKVNTSTSPAGSTTLTVAGSQTDGFLAGDSVISDPAAAGPATITAVDNTAVTVVPTSASWVVGQKLKRDPASYLQITGSPITVSAAPFTTANIPQANLAVSSKYYARVQYATTNASAATSLFSGWSGFATASSFLPTPGTAFGGGYFAGQINDGGTIYNLIVAPVTSGALNGQNGGASPTGIAYKTSNAADLPSATVQNEVYGGPTTDLFKASAAHPAFSTFINGASGPNAGAFNLATGGAGGGTGIGGFNDWYLPAKNELEILYFNLKPTTTSNNTSSGINPNAVPARASNYTAGNPAQTTNSLFQSGGAQAFSTGGAYWSSSEDSSLTTLAWLQNFITGFQGNVFKTGTNYARAVRRVSA